MADEGTGAEPATGPDATPAGGDTGDRVAELEASIKRLEGVARKERKAAREARAALKPYEGLDPEEARDALDRAAAAQEAEAKEEGRLDEWKEAFTARHAKELESLQGERDTYRTALEKALISDGLTRAIVESGFHPDYQKAARLELMEKRPKVINGEDGAFRAVFVDEVGDEVAIADYVKTWSQTEDAARYMPGSGASGGGADSSGAKRKSGVKVIDASDSVAIARYAKEISEGTVEVRQ